MIISVGEKLSCQIFASVLRSEGVDAVYVNLERVVDKAFLENQLDHTFYAYLRDRFLSVLENLLAEGRVPVVTGSAFFSSSFFLFFLFHFFFFFFSFFQASLATFLGGF